MNDMMQMMAAYMQRSNGSRTPTGPKGNFPLKMTTDADEKPPTRNSVPPLPNLPALQNLPGRWPSFDSKKERAIISATALDPASPSCGQPHRRMWSGTFCDTKYTWYT